MYGEDYNVKLSSKRYKYAKGSTDGSFTIYTITEKVQELYKEFPLEVKWTASGNHSHNQEKYVKEVASEAPTLFVSIGPSDDQITTLHNHMRDHIQAGDLYIIDIHPDLFKPILSLVHDIDDTLRAAFREWLFTIVDIRKIIKQFAITIIKKTEEETNQKITDTYRNQFDELQKKYYDLLDEMKKQNADRQPQTVSSITPISAPASIPNTADVINKIPDNIDKNTFFETNLLFRAVTEKFDRSGKKKETLIRNVRDFLDKNPDYKAMDKFEDQYFYLMLFLENKKLIRSTPKMWKKESDFSLEVNTLHGEFLLLTRYLPDSQQLIPALFDLYEAWMMPYAVQLYQPKQQIYQVNVVSIDAFD